MELARFRVLICSKVGHKINIIRRNLYTSVQKAQDLKVNKMHLCLQYDDHKRNYISR